MIGLSLLFCFFLTLSIFAGSNSKLEDKHTLYIIGFTAIIGVLLLINILMGY